MSNIYEFMAKQTKTDKLILTYCQEHNIKLLIDPQLGKNDGLCYPDSKEIHLSEKYSSAKHKLACFLHEVGHLKSEKLKNADNIFECEFLAWSWAIRIHKKLVGCAFKKQQAEYMLKCLKTYCRSQYEFKRLNYKEEA